MKLPDRLESETALEDVLAEPSEADVACVRRLNGDVLILGAGGKMGPSLAAMTRRAADALGDGRRVIAVSRWGSEAGAAAARRLEAMGVDVRRADLEDERALATLPDAPNIIYMAGQKFGTSDAPWRTWMMNVVLPARVAGRFPEARMVAFSTGNVYPLVPADSSGAREDDPLTPLGEYANSCVGRERVLEAAARAHGSPLTLIRLFYAVDLRYGVLVDIAARVLAGQPVDLRMGWVNVIWQGDANAQAIRLLAHAAVPPLAVNVTGPERLSVRHVATRLGERLGREPLFVSDEALDALLADTALARRLVGTPAVSAETLIDWVADWVGRGGERLAKPTGFDVRDGRF